MSDGDWIALVGIIVTIIINITSSINDNKKTRASNSLTRESIQVAHKNNERSLKQERAEEALSAISKFDGILWSKYLILQSHINNNVTTAKDYAMYSELKGNYRSWTAYLTTKAVDTKIIKNNLADGINKVKEFIS